MTGPNTTVENIALTEDGGISGTVTDAQTALPIAGVTVTCSACGTTTATTDGSGLYAFTNVAPSTYSLTFSDTGYVSQTASGIVVTPGTTSTETRRAHGGRRDQRDGHRPADQPRRSQG